MNLFRKWLGLTCPMTCMRAASLPWFQTTVALLRRDIGSGQTAIYEEVGACHIAAVLGRQEQCGGGHLFGLAKSTCEAAFTRQCIGAGQTIAQQQYGSTTLATGKMRSNRITLKINNDSVHSPIGRCTKRRFFLAGVSRNFISNSVRRGPLQHYKEVRGEGQQHATAGGQIASTA